MHRSFPTCHIENSVSLLCCNGTHLKTNACLFLLLRSSRRAPQSPPYPAGSRPYKEKLILTGKCWNVSPRRQFSITVLVQYPLDKSISVPMHNPLKPQQGLANTRKREKSCAPAEGILTPVNPSRGLANRRKRGKYARSLCRRPPEI